MSRRDKLYARLRAEEAELREQFVTNLRLVASGRNTMFFTLVDGVPTATGEPIFTRAKTIIALASQLDEPESELVAGLVLGAFRAANEQANEQRLGPIRLAQELLKQVGET